MSQPDLIEENVRLVYWTLHRYFPRWAQRQETDDLAGEGMLGLIRAAQAYDPAQGEFSTFAVACIYRAIQAGLRTIGRHQARGVESIDALEGFDLIDHRHERQLQADRLADRAEAVHQAVNRLPDRQRHVMRQRLAGETFDVVGQGVGLCKERIRQIETKAISTLSTDKALASAYRN